MRTLRTALWSVTAAVLIPFAASAVTITLGPSSARVASEITNGDGGCCSEDGDDVFSLPFTGSQSISNAFGSSATQYDFTDSVLEATFQHTRTSNSYISDSFGVVHFTANSNGAYVIEGQYDVDDLYGRLAHVTVTLREDGVVVASYSQTLENGVPDPSFTVNLGGALVAGRQYQLNYAFAIGGNGQTVGGIGPVSADGFFRFSAVPEPGTALLVAAGLAALAARRR